MQSVAQVQGTAQMDEEEYQDFDHEGVSWSSESDMEGGVGSGRDGLFNSDTDDDEPTGDVAKVSADVRRALDKRMDATMVEWGRQRVPTTGDPMSMARVLLHQLWQNSNALACQVGPWLHVQDEEGDLGK